MKSQFVPKSYNVFDIRRPKQRTAATTKMVSFFVDLGLFNDSRIFDIWLTDQSSNTNGANSRNS